ncbi:MAG: Glutamate decarboxylase [Pelotomaculum sp. PtaB.Bin104]|nr:MAG: Glutamate decarboxylase [Pelotomaculum sp. PtaB.Bin104]
MLAKKVNPPGMSGTKQEISPTYSLRYFTESIPKYHIPKDGMPANAAYQLIHDALHFDGRTAFDIGSFTTIWMEPEAQKLIMENLGKNFIDRFEYPETAEIHQRIVNMLGHLFNAHEQDDFCGTATVGSSEAIELGLLAHKWTWKRNRIKQGKGADKPNIIFGADAHICWDKFARYFDVEPRIIPMEKDRFCTDAKSVMERIDENTICVGAIMGTTFTGACDPVKEINDLLVQVKENKGWDIPIHVDAASAGFILPFINPQLEWDFRLPQVRSINVSGHKFGLVYPGVGWLIFKNHTDLPEDLIFYVNYLGDDMPTYTLNFSRGSDMVLAQYYNLLHLGRSGYTKVMNNCMNNARYLANKLTGSGIFELVNNLELPIITFRFKKTPDFAPFQLSQKLRERGWMLPAYNLPENADDMTVMRVVVRETFSRDMAETFYDDIVKAYQTINKTEMEHLRPNVPPRRGHHVT